jgi:hypothetical protein
LGFRPHTYWTAAVALAGPANAPQVLERRRIVFAKDLERFVYHQAAEAPAGALRLIEKVREATVANAAREIGMLAEDLAGDGVTVRSAATAAATARLPASLAEILAVHALMHAAEGSFYRDVVAAGCETTGLAVTRVAEKDLPSQVAAQLGLGGKALDAKLKAMGAALGPPWNEDYRLATLAAWTLL